MLNRVARIKESNFPRRHGAGYVNAHARQHSSAPDKLEPAWIFAIKRAGAIFPVYALGMVIAVILRMADNRRLPNWWILGSQVRTDHMLSLPRSLPMSCRLWLPGNFHPSRGCACDCASEALHRRQGFLLQSFLPWMTERGLQAHCWFLSCMVLYWLIFPTAYRFTRKLTLPAVTFALALCAIPPWLLAIVPAASGGRIDEDWFSQHRGGRCPPLCRLG